MKDQIAPSDESKALLITIDEAAERLSIGRSHIYQQMQLGRLRSVHIGRSRRILESDLEAFIIELLDNPDHVALHHELPRPKAAVKRLPALRGRR